jgi:alpha-L-rhamnosidase
MKKIARQLSRVLAVMLILVLSGSASLASTAQGGNIDELQRSFERPPDDARIMMRWWWFGPAVNKAELEREMRLMKEGGIGGFEINPVYPLLPDDPTKGFKNYPFLSDEYIDALRFVSGKARELGLRMDLTLGSGWPFGGPTVPITDASGMLRSERVKIEASARRVPIPSINVGEKLLAAFLARTQGQTIVADSLREVTDIREGVALLPSDLRGANEVLFFISSRTGMQVKRPAVGAEGYVLNHMDRTATENYLKSVGDRLMQAFGQERPYSVFGDSLEVYNQDWTDDFLEEFRRRRGYDLKPYLPALIADMGPKTAAVRYDWGRTQTELLNERFLAPVREWAKRNRTLLRFQAYGIPAATISSNAFVDLSDGEGAQWKVVRATRWASSASHLYGRPVTASETWTWLHSPVFRATPLDMKAEGDLHFLMGINQLIGHGWPYTAPGVEYPGWRFYAAAVFDEKNPWWIVMPDIALYLQRLSHLMRQGQPANDVALYLPNSDAWSSFTAGKVHMIETLREMVGTDVLTTVMATGYGFDFFDDDALKQVGRVERGALALGPNKYRVVILPGVEHIPLETLRRLEEFVKGGGTLIATRRLPQVAPGLQATEAEQNQVREISRRLFEGSSAPARFAADENRQLAGVLTSALRPDVALAPTVPDIGFIHRRTSDAEIYFLANTTNAPQSVKATFRVEGMQPELWNPMTGRVSTADVSARAEGGTTLALDLEPYGSRVIVFSKRTLPGTGPAATTTAAAAPPVDLSTGWRVSFGQNSTPVMMDQLRSWTESEETRYFSGTATYEKEVSVPESMLQKGQTVRLDFGEGKAVPPQPLRNGMRTWLDAPVREAAVVYVNDRRAGSVWCPPYSLDVTGLLRGGTNKIRIEVGNLALNYMAGRRLPDYRLLNLRYGERFQPQDMDKVQPIPAGLLGPIRLIANANTRP